MKNFEFHKTAEEVIKVFNDFCTGRECDQCKYRDGHSISSCIVKWLYDEVKLKPCPSCVGEAKLDVVNGEFLVTCKHCLLVE